MTRIQLHVRNVDKLMVQKAMLHMGYDLGPAKKFGYGYSLVWFRVPEQLVPRVNAMRIAFDLMYEIDTRHMIQLTSNK